MQSFQSVVVVGLLAVVAIGDEHRSERRRFEDLIGRWDQKQADAANEPYYRRPPGEPPLPNELLGAGWWKNVERRAKQILRKDPTGLELIANVPWMEFQTLKDGIWLEATVIDGYLSHLTRGTHHFAVPIQEFIKYRTLGDINANVKSAYKRLPGKAQIILFPTNTDTTGRGSHWILTAVNRAAGTMGVYDSFGIVTGERRKTILEAAQGFVNILDSKWDREFHEDHIYTPKQPDDSSCGIATMVNAKRLIHNQCFPKLSRGSVSYYRRYIASYLLQANKTVQ